MLETGHVAAKHPPTCLVTPQTQPCAALLLLPSHSPGSRQNVPSVCKHVAGPRSNTLLWLLAWLGQRWQEAWWEGAGVSAGAAVCSLSVRVRQLSWRLVPRPPAGHMTVFYLGDTGPHCVALGSLELAMWIRMASKTAPDSEACLSFPPEYALIKSLTSDTKFFFFF